MYDTDTIQDSDVDLADLLQTNLSPDPASGEMDPAKFFFVDSSTNTLSDNADLLSDVMNLPSGVIPRALTSYDNGDVMDLPPDVMSPGSCACISADDMDLSPPIGNTLINDHLMSSQYVVKSKYFEDLKELSAESMYLTTSGTFVDDLLSF